MITRALTNAPSPSARDFWGASGACSNVIAWIPAWAGSVP